MILPFCFSLVLGLKLGIYSYCLYDMEENMNKRNCITYPEQEHSFTVSKASEGYSQELDCPVIDLELKTGSETVYSRIPVDPKLSIFAVRFARSIGVYAEGMTCRELLQSCTGRSGRACFRSASGSDPVLYVSRYCC